MSPRGLATHQLQPSHRRHDAILPLFCPTSQIRFGIAEVDPDDAEPTINNFSDLQNVEILTDFYCAWGCFRRFVLTGDFYAASMSSGAGPATSPSRPTIKRSAICIS